MSESPFTHEDREAVAMMQAVFDKAVAPLWRETKYRKVRDLLERVQREVEAAPPPPPPAGWYLWDSVEAVYYPGTGSSLFIRSDLLGRVWSSIHGEEFNRLTVLRLDEQAVISRPDDIPEDLWTWTSLTKLARDLLATAGSDSERNAATIVQAVANAIRNTANPRWSES